MFDADDTKLDEIIALDAQTLQLRHRFGLGLLDEAGQMAVGGDELYVCDTSHHRLQVFSLTGEHRRSIVGEWRSPEMLCFAKDRLYLVEEYFGIPPTRLCFVKDRLYLVEGDDEDDGDTTALVRSRRIPVLSLQGDILQVVTHPTEPTARFHSICCFDDKLLANYTYVMESAGARSSKDGMLALQGL